MTTNRWLLLLASFSLLACADQEGSSMSRISSYGGSGGSPLAGAAGSAGAGSPGGSPGAGAAGAAGGAGGAAGQASAGSAGGAGASPAGQGGAGSEAGQAGASAGGTGGAAGAGGQAQAGQGGGACEALPWATSWEKTGIDLPLGAFGYRLFATQEGVIAVSDSQRFFRLDGSTFTDLGEPEFSEPMKGSGALLARDEARKEFLLFGNSDVDLTTGESTLHEDTWTLSLADMTWKKRCAPCGLAPAARTISYDSDRERVMVISEDNPATGLGIPSLSEWDGEAWTKVCGPGKQACPFGNATPMSQAYDRARKATTLLALTMGNKNIMETWTYDAGKPELARWENHKAPASGKATFQPIEYDDQRQRVAQNMGTYGAHEWDGSCWTYAENKGDTVKLTITSIARVAGEKRSLAVGDLGIDEQGNQRLTLLARVDP